MKTLVGVLALLVSTGTAISVTPARHDVGKTAVANNVPGRRPPRTGIGPITRQYDVRLAYIGYTGLAKSKPCDAVVDLAGYDSLVGTVKGVEDPAEPEEDVVYRGTLLRFTKLDYCLTRPNPTVDQVRWCVTRLTGAARMQVEITVYGDSNMGAWMKAVPDSTPPDSVKVKGDCMQPDMDSVRVDYPSGESGGSPDGQPLRETAATAFAVNGVRRLRVGYFPPDPVQGGWGLRITRAVP